MARGSSRLGRAIAAILFVTCPALAKDDTALAPSRRAEVGNAVFTAELERSTLGLGERIVLRLSLETPEAASAHLSDPVGDLHGLRPIGIEDTGPIRLSDHRLRWLRTVTLEATQTGPAQINGLTAEVLDMTRGTATPQVLRLAVLELEVTTVLPAEAALNKPRGPGLPLSLPKPDMVTPAILAAVAVAALLALLAIPVWQRRRGRPGRTTGQTDTSAEQAAIAGLAALSAKSDMSGPEIEIFHESVAQILRQYLYLKFGLEAPYRTTQEVLAAMNRADTAIAGTALAPLLTGCDLVKFARIRPDRNFMQRLLESAAEFVTGASPRLASDLGNGAVE